MGVGEHEGKCKYKMLWESAEELEWVVPTLLSGEKSYWGMQRGE